MSKHKERQFQIEIVEHLTSNNWVEGNVSGYDRELVSSDQSIYKKDQVLSRNKRKLSIRVI